MGELLEDMPGVLLAGAIILILIVGGMILGWATTPVHETVTLAPSETHQEERIITTANEEFANAWKVKDPKNAEIEFYVNVTYQKRDGWETAYIEDKIFNTTTTACVLNERHLLRKLPSPPYTLHFYWVNNNDFPVTVEYRVDKRATIPGFDVLSIAMAILVCILIYRYKKKKDDRKPNVKAICRELM